MCGRAGAEAPVEGLVGEVEDAAVRGDHEVARPVGDHAGDGGVEGPAAHGAAEAGAEGEGPAVGGDQPVAGLVGVGDEALDGGVEVGASHRAVEGGVAEGEDAAVGCHHVVPMPARCGDGVEDRSVQPGTGHVALERSVAARDDPSPVGEDPVAVSGRGAGEADGPFPRGQASGLAMVDGVAPGGDRSAGVEDPVAVPGQGRLQVDRLGGRRCVAVVAGITERVHNTVGTEHPVPGRPPDDRAGVAHGDRRSGGDGGGLRCRGRRPVRPRRARRRRARCRGRRGGRCRRRRRVGRCVLDAGESPIRSRALPVDRHAVRERGGAGIVARIGILQQVDELVGVSGQVVVLAEHNRAVAVVLDVLELLGSDRRPVGD